MTNNLRTACFREVHSLAKTLALLTVLATSCLGQTNQPPNQPRQGTAAPEAAPAKPTGPVASKVDLFSDVRARALAADNEWFSAHQNLESDLSRLPDSCVPEGYQMITELKAAHENAIALKKVYYQKHLDNEEAAAKDLDKAYAQIPASQNGINSMLDDTKAQLEDLNSRRAQLVASASKSNVDISEPLKLLDERKDTLAEQLDNANRAIDHWNRAKTLTGQAKRLAEAKRDAARALVSLLISESHHLSAYYDAVNARLRLECGRYRSQGLRRFERRIP